MKYAVIGTGAIGGFYGGLLAHHGQEVHFLLHSDYEHVRQNGFAVKSPKGDFRLDTPYIYNSTQDMPKADVVLVGLKTTANHLLPTLLPPLLHDNTVVVLIQNGIGVEAALQSQMPHVQLAAGLAFICSAKSGPGEVTHQCYGDITLASYSCRHAEQQLNSIAADLTNAGVGVATLEYNTARWRKAVWNMPFNGMTVAMRTQTDQLLANPATRTLIREQMMEVIGAARHLGVKDIDSTFADHMLKMTDEMTPYSPSMRLDYDLHRHMEIEYLYRQPIQTAQKAGFPMPRLEMLMRQLQFIDDNNV